MNNVLWIIQQIDGIHYNWTAFYEAALKNGSQVVFCRMEALKTLNSNDNFPVIIGGEDYLLEASKNSYLVQGVFFKNDFYRVDNYIACLGDRFLNYDMHFFSLEDLSKIEGGVYFIRPLYDSKCFDGAKYNLNDKTILAKFKCRNCMHYGEKCVGLSSVKDTGKEWRAVIVKNKLISICRYAEKGIRSIDAKDVPDNLIDFCEQIIKVVKNPPIAFVLDIVELEKKYKVLEFNIFNASNLYDCDRLEIIRALENALLD